MILVKAKYSKATTVPPPKLLKRELEFGETLGSEVVSGYSSGRLL